MFYICLANVLTLYNQCKGLLKHSLCTIRMHGRLVALSCFVLNILNAAFDKAIAHLCWWKMHQNLVVSHRSQILLKLSATRRLLPIIPNRNLYNNGGILLPDVKDWTSNLCYSVCVDRIVFQSSVYVV